MQADFHYYATYSAAYLAGFSHEECIEIAYSAQFVDLCSKTLLNKLKAPACAATTQLQLEMMDMRTDIPGLLDITRIWTSFHFLPYDLNAKLKWHSKFYMDKYRLMCNPNGALLSKTVELAAQAGAGDVAADGKMAGAGDVASDGKMAGGNGNNLEAIGIAMHVLADTWAHRYFVGTPSYVMNNTGNDFYEVTKGAERKINFVHVPGILDDLDKNKFTNSIHQSKERTVMNLGHGRAGHLPDYSFITYRYVPAWKKYETIVKNNPEDYYKAFCQMVYAMKYLRGDIDKFEVDTYAYDIVEPYREEIMGIIKIKQLIASEAFGEKLSGENIPDWNTEKYQDEYVNASPQKKNDTLIGKFVTAAINHKNMVTEEIFNSGNMLAGISIRIPKRKKLRKRFDFSRIL